MQMSLDYEKAERKTFYFTHFVTNQPASSHVWTLIVLNNDHKYTLHVAFYSTNWLWHPERYIPFSYIPVARQPLEAGRSVCVCLAVSLRLIPPQGSPSHPETTEPAKWTISLFKDWARELGKKGWTKENDKGNLPWVNTAACCCHAKPAINHGPELLVVTAARTHRFLK